MTLNLRSNDSSGFLAKSESRQDEMRMKKREIHNVEKQNTRAAECNPGV
jgi:hypothetical protein